MTESDLVVVPRWRKVALAACLFAITGSFGFLQPFTTPYLAASGLSRGRIGLLTGLATACAVLIQPLLGKLSDRLDARRPVMIGAACTAAVAYLAFRNADSYLGFLLLSIVGVNGFSYLNTVGGVLVGRLVSASGAGTGGGGAAFVKYRVWGSVGYIVVGVTTGLLLPARPGMARSDLDPVFLFGPLLFFAIAALSFFVPDLRRPPAPPRLSGDASEQPISRPILPWAESNLRWFQAAFFLYNVSLYGASAYLPLFLKELGATPRQIPLFFACGVVTEVLVMSQVGRWTDKHGRIPALRLAFVLMPLRLLLYVFATTPAMAMGIQALHGFNFGIVGAISVVLVNDSASDSGRGAAQARLAATAGVGLALGPAICGWIAQSYSLTAMFGVMSAVGFAAAALLVATVRETHPDLRGRERS